MSALSQVLAFPKPPQSEKARAYQSWCDALDVELVNAKATGREITAHHQALQRLRLLAMLCASRVVEEGKSLGHVATPEHPEDTLERMFDAISDALGLSPEASHVLGDRQQ